jgi:hypothetical protein
MIDYNPILCVLPKSFTSVLRGLFLTWGTTGHTNRIACLAVFDGGKLLLGVAQSLFFIKGGLPVHVAALLLIRPFGSQCCVALSSIGESEWVWPKLLLSPGRM